MAPIATLLVEGARGCLPMLMEPLMGSLSPRRYKTTMIRSRGIKFLTPSPGSIEGHQSFVVNSTPPLAIIPKNSPPSVAQELK